MDDTSADEAASSTRVFVSGLPPTFTSDDLRAHFDQKYSATDAHVLRDRRIGFVGFHDHETADNAVRYFNKSYIRMSKIAVSLAKPIDVKRDASGQAAPVSHRREIPRGEIDSNISRKRKRVAHDDGEAIRNPQSVTESEKAGQAPSAEVSEGNNADDGFDGFDSDHEGAPLQFGDSTVAASDNDWLRGKTSRTLDLLGADDAPTLTGSSGRMPAPSLQPEPVQAKEPEDHVQEASEAIEDVVSVPNGRLFVRNLAFMVSDDDLNNLFAGYGKITEVHVVKDHRTQKSKGLGFAQFLDPEDAVKALRALDGRSFQGRLLHLLPASDKKDQKMFDFDISKLPLKQQKALKRKSEATSSTFSWNSLYMNPDAVLSSTAQRLGVSKAELLDPSSTDAAVKQAHAETAIIQEAKEYFRKQKINVDAFSEQRRDDRCLLLKNFSYGTTSEELSAMLSKYGTLDRLIFPPSGTMAIARFDDPLAAKAALKGLAYSNLKGSMLYLEKAPRGLFDVPADNKLDADARNAVPEEDAPGQTTQLTTIFVRNLNFATSTARLKEVFKPLSGFMSAKVKTRTDKARPGEILSMGFGFAEFRTKSQAEAAIATMNGHRLDGHELVVQLSNKISDAAEERRKEDSSKKADQAKTKIVVKNLPFETSRKDLRALFGAYGQLRSIRMPRKFDNSARGFAFAEFVTAKEAKSAMEALSSTHLLGRKLVLDFAEGETDNPEETIRAMEKKAGRHEHLANVTKMLSGSARKKFAVEDSARDEDA